MAKFKFLLAMLGIICACAQSASASIIGDEVNYSFEGELINEITAVPLLVPMGGLTRDSSITLPDIGSGSVGEAFVFTLDDGTLVLDYSAFFDFSGTSGFDHDFDGLTLNISDLDWIGDPGFVSNFQQTSSISGIMTAFTADSLTVTLAPFTLLANENLEFQATFTFYVDHGTTPDVPEPATIVLLGLGAVGMALRKRSH